MHDERNNRNHDQQVNEPACDVKSKPSHEPPEQEHKEQDQKNKIRYQAHRLFSSATQAQRFDAT
jgi:hypothetical protein